MPEQGLARASGIVLPGNIVAEKSRLQDRVDVHVDEADIPLEGQGGRKFGRIPRNIGAHFVL
jgi:hypothetical protein